ncbi:PDZ/DHR/GLGF domain protein [Trichostrongylus colubriformis]|uniref:PDZ/DHR/GLGF domain protein n=1 Tax=Trichostrongylus colubriformis TaxID=6319 RepID=A0AAN8FM87_TRICO
MVSNSDKSSIVDERPIDHAGVPLLPGLNEVAKKPKTEEGIYLGKGCDPSKITMITLERSPQGEDRTLQLLLECSCSFEIMLEINGIDLIDKTHDEAVSIFRAQNQNTADLLVEVGAENRILNEHLTTDLHISAGKSPTDVERAEVLSGLLTPAFRRSFGDGFNVRSTPSPSFGADSKGHDEDADSETSGAPSVHSILDDVPRTPKRPMSYLDPRNPSLVTEVLYVSIGLAVISLGVFVVYRIVRRRR